jgi:hypothetical protein
MRHSCERSPRVEGDDADEEADRAVVADGELVVAAARSGGARDPCLEAAGVLTREDGDVRGGVGGGHVAQGHDVGAVAQGGDVALLTRVEGDQLEEDAAWVAVVVLVVGAREGGRVEPLEAVGVVHGLATQPVARVVVVGADVLVQVRQELRELSPHGVVDHPARRACQRGVADQRRALVWQPRGQERQDLLELRLDAAALDWAVRGGLDRAGGVGGGGFCQVLVEGCVQLFEVVIDPSRGQGEWCTGEGAGADAAAAWGRVCGCELRDQLL